MFLGNMMTLLYMFGLATGSLVAYSLEKLLNPLDENHCNSNDIHLQIPEHTTNYIFTNSVFISTPSTIITTISSTLISTIAENVTDISR